MVNLTKIYTRTGDAGKTRLSNNEEVAKTDSRVDAYGHVDELNGHVGIVLALEGVTEDMRSMLTRIQNELFDLGADLSNPVVADPPWEPLRIIAESIDQLEAWCDEYNEDLDNLRSFILPGGTLLSAHLNVCRSITRRAERAAWRAAEDYGLEDGTTAPDGGVNILAIRYLNRLSDLFFILGRVANKEAGVPDVLWVPGGDRPKPQKDRP